jgi:hypothetical protein
MKRCWVWWPIPLICNLHSGSGGSSLCSLPLGCIVRPCLLKNQANEQAKNLMAVLWWVMPVILAIWKANIRRIMVLGKPRQIVLETPSPQ